MTATWENTKERSKSGWDCMSVYAKTFEGDSKILLGIDNTNPAETRIDTERRISNRFGYEPKDLILEII